MKVSKEVGKPDSWAFLALRVVPNYVGKPRNINWGSVQKYQELRLGGIKLMYLYAGVANHLEACTRVPLQVTIYQGQFAQFSGQYRVTVW